ncbi:MAG: cbb3-type cytochrome oxidase assembly protein CcoS [Bacteroidetes bacterium]|nr:cbb3-type cytochrome oxidase assembly protein CcoS [Bacteroidota bacterium]MCH8523308.1 cbb3-type cytochrome oxidase assembly protein CcoS [Balneolales bacterium]
MSVMYLLIMISLILASGFVIAFVWAIRSGQYDDKYTPSVRVLFDDHPVGDEDEPDKNRDKTADEHVNEVPDPLSTNAGKGTQKNQKKPK